MGVTAAAAALAAEVPLLAWVALAAALLAAAVAAAAALLPASLRPAALLERWLFPDANQVLLAGGGAAGMGPSGGKDHHNKGGPAGQRRNVYRIAAFGDSLTEGFTEGGSAFHPYAGRLGDRLYKQLPEGWHLEIEEQGESGDRVLIGMPNRLQRALDEHLAAGRPYDWVLLLGGINDLAGDESTAEEVMEGLAALTRASLEHGANVLLMTLTEVASPEPSVEAKRRQLNSLIKAFCARREDWAAAAAAGAARASQPPPPQQGQGQGQTQPPPPPPRRAAPRVALFDLAAALPYASLDERRRWELWHDGVHLTLEGYEHMGELISTALAPLVLEELSSCAARQQQQQRTSSPGVTAEVVGGGSKKHK